MKSNLYIPQKIHVGFQKRDDTFTGKLAYVIYEDENGVLRKKSSWDGWRDSKIKEVVLDNEPNRFVFNKGVQRHGYFGSGRSVMRVYDTRDFEFEISIENLVGILMHSDISKRDIVEECVFAWAGKDLVLLPVNSEEYRESVEYTNKQALKVSSKDLVKGYLYEKKKSDEELMYMGYHEYFDKEYHFNHKCYGKKHVFYDIKNKIFVTPSIGTLAQVKVEEVQDNFAEIDKLLHASIHLYEIKSVEVQNLKNKKKDNYSYAESRYKKIGNKIFQLTYNNYYSKDEVNPEHVYVNVAEFKKDGKTSQLNFENFNDVSVVETLLKEIDLNWKYGKDSYYYSRNSLKGETYSKKEYLEKLKNAGFGNHIVAINVLDKKTDWI